MKKLNLIPILLLITTLSFSQKRDSVETRLDSISKYYFGKRVSVISPMIGYDVNFKVNEKYDSLRLSKFTSHWIELGIIKTKFYPINRHGGASFSYYFSNSFKISTSDFIIGPKIGCVTSVWAFMIGSEIVYYTNFSESSWRYRPIFGLGAEKFQIIITPHIVLSNQNMTGLGRAGGFDLTIRWHLFDRNKYGYWRYRRGIDYHDFKNSTPK